MEGSIAKIFTGQVDPSTLVFVPDPNLPEATQGSLVRIIMDQAVVCRTLASGTQNLQHSPGNYLSSMKGLHTLFALLEGLVYAGCVDTAGFDRLWADLVTVMAHGDYPACVATTQRALQSALFKYVSSLRAFATGDPNMPRVTFAPDQSECFDIVRAYWSAFHTAVQVAKNTSLSSPGKHPMGTVANHGGGGTQPPKRARVEWVQGSRVDKVSVKGNVLTHESTVYKLKPLTDFFKKHNVPFIPGYHTSNHKSHKFRLQYVDASLDGSKFKPPVPNWFTNCLMNGPDFR